jgi:hypothetical protein
MKAMKKLSFIIIILISAISLEAQKLVGFRAGYNYSNLNITSTGQVDKTKSLNSFHAGLTANLPFLLFSFQTSLMVTGKGSTATHGDPNSSDYYVAKTNPIYLEIPSTFNINFRFGSKSGLFFGIGPYIAMGIAGQNSVYGVNDSASFSSKSKIQWTHDDPTTPNVEEGAAYGKLRRFDYGGTVTAGIFIHGAMLSAYYDFGVPKINSLSNSNQEDDLRNQVFGVSLGLLFGGD